MLSNGDKKKIGAVAGVIVIGTGLLFGLIKMNDKPKKIVGKEYSMMFEESSSLSEESSVESSRKMSSSAKPKKDKSKEKKPKESYGSTRLPEQSEESLNAIFSNELDLHASQNTASEKPEEKQDSKTEQSQSPSSQEAPDSESADEKNPKEESTPAEESRESTESESGETSSSDSAEEKSSSSDSQESSSEEREESSSDSEEDEQSEKAPEDSSETKEEEDAGSLSTETANALLEMNVYEKQKLGNTAVPFYQHPSLSVGIDLREQSQLQRELYMEPTAEGFVIFPRAMLGVLDLDSEDLTALLAEGESIPGTITVKRVDKATRDAMEKEDSSGAMRFVEAEEGMFYAILPDPEGRASYQGIYDHLSTDLTPQLIADNLTTVGLIGDLKPEVKDVTLAQQQHQWESIVTEMKQSAAEVEMKWNLPLLADSDVYQVQGQDIRQNIPAPGVNATYGDSSATGNPAYSFGRTDLNGDGTPEYLIRAQVGEMQSGQSDGYWAILEPTPSGLKVANVVPQGNGDLYLRGDTLILPSLEREDHSLTLTLSESKVGKEASSNYPSLTFTLVEGESGQELAQKYSEDSLVLMNEQIYRFSMQELDRYMDYVLNQIGKAERLTFAGHITEEESGTVNPHGMERTPVEDPAALLAESYPELPLSTEVIDQAVSTTAFQNVTDPLTADQFTASH